MFTIYQAESCVLRIHSCSRKAAGGAEGPGRGREAWNNMCACSFIGQI